MTSNAPEQSSTGLNTSQPGEPPASQPDGPPSESVRVHRGADRASYDQQIVHEILDAGWLAHVGTVRDGLPIVIPMFYARDGDCILIHGAPASGVIRRGKGTDVCITVTHLDGFVLARSSFHHSVNYRCVMIIGEAQLITDPAEKEAALDLFVERLIPGRMAQLRPSTTKEIQGTSVLRVSLEQASTKVRTGDPIDDEEDYDYDVWAGVVPLTTLAGRPIADARLREGIELPENLKVLTGYDLAD